MSAIDTQRTVNEIVAERLDRARVFEALGIDYCCGGKRPLAEICREKGIDAAVVAQQVAESDAGAPPAGGADYRTMPLGAFCDDIVATHHAYLRRELPRLGEMVNKIATKRPDDFPWMPEVRDVFNQFAAEIESHAFKEENVLFPMIAQLESAERMPSLHCGSVANPIRVMEMEHDGAGDALARMRELTNGFTPVPEACNTHRVMLAGLAELELDMHQHVHKENAILFPRAIARERELCR